MPFHILVVDDNPDSISIMVATLKKQGHRLDFAQNGLEALGKIQESRPDVILMDMAMPIIDGMHASEILKDFYYSKDIPIIGISAHTKIDDIKRAMDSGCDAYISKPVRFQELQDTLTKLLA